MAHYVTSATPINYIDGKSHKTVLKSSRNYSTNHLRLRVMRLILNIIFSGVIVILAYKSVITFRFTLWLLSVMNKSIKD